MRNFSVAVCLREQLLPKDQIIPHTSRDWDVDILVTPDETITSSRGHDEEA